MKLVVLLFYIHSCVIGNKDGVLMHADKNHKTEVKDGSEV